MSIKFAFFDVDGTLSVPIFQENDSFVIGFSEEDWKKYCMWHKEDIFSTLLLVNQYKIKVTHVSSLVCDL